MKRLVEQTNIQLMNINEKVEVSSYNIIKIGDLIKLSANIVIKQNIENQLIIKFENDNAVSAINFSENKTNSLSKPEKRLDEMSDKEVEELLKKLI